MGSELQVVRDVRRCFQSSSPSHTVGLEQEIADGIILLRERLHPTRWAQNRHFSTRLCRILHNQFTIPHGGLGTDYQFSTWKALGFELAPSHTVGSEPPGTCAPPPSKIRHHPIQWAQNEQLEKLVIISILTSPSHTVGLERGRERSLRDQDDKQVTIPHSGLRTFSAFRVSL